MMFEIKSYKVLPLHRVSTEFERVFSLEQGFPGGISGKEPTCQCRRCKKHGFDLWVGKIPWRRMWQPTPVFFPGESHGERSMEGYSP